MRAKTLLTILCAAGLAGCSGAPPQEKSAPSATPASASSSLQAITAEAKRESLQSALTLTGTVLATEEKAVVLTAPMDANVDRPLMRVGEYVAKGRPVIQLNSVFGMSALQVLNKLETDQAAVVSANTALSTALSTLIQSRTAVGQAEALVASTTSDLRQAESDQAFVTSDLHRKIDLHRAGVSSRADVEDAQNRYNKAMALIQSARIQVAIARRNVPLVRGNVSQYEAAVASARMAVGLAVSNFERDKAVYTQSQLVGANLPPGLTSANLAGGSVSQGNAAQASLFFVSSPISGVVTKLVTTNGQRVHAGDELGRVVDLSSVYVDANAFEGDVSSLHIGDPLECDSPAVPGKTFHGRVSYIGRVVNTDTRAIQVRALIENPRGELRPDTFVSVRIQQATRANVLLVPEKALISLGNQIFVLVKTGPDKFKRVQVEIGARSGGKAEIVKGLNPGDPVVTDGNLLLEARDRGQ